MLNQYFFFVDNDWKITEYVYKMIETLLPKASFEDHLNYEDLKKFKMMELLLYFLI